MVLEITNYLWFQTVISHILFEKLVYILQLIITKVKVLNNPLSMPGVIILCILIKNISNKLKLLRWVSQPFHEHSPVLPNLIVLGAVPQLLP